MAFHPHVPLTAVVCAGLLGSCASEPEAPGETATFVIAELEFLTQPEEDGSVRGFDLDGIDHTETPGPEGCFKRDHLSPEGEVGVDNQLAQFGNAIVVFGADSVATIVQNAVNSGVLLLLVQIEGLNDWQDDPEVTLRFRLGSGPVDVGNDDHLVPGQSFDPREGYPMHETVNAYIEDGVLHARDVAVTLPIEVLGVDLDFPMLDGRAELVLDEESHSLRGRVGGGVPMETFDELVDDIYIASGMDSSISGLVEQLLTGLADLAPRGDGTCARMSGGMDIGGVRAFLLEE